jgi:6-phosphogluconolactonase
MHRRRFSSLIGATLLAFATPKSKAISSQYLLYVGTYSKNIYAFRYDAATGGLEPLSEVGELVHPSFLTADSHHRFLFAVSERDGKEIGAVASFEIDYSNGKLKLLSTQSSEGLSPCHLAVDRTNKMLAAANYGSGSVATYPLGADGKIGRRISLEEAAGSGPGQRAPHAHQTVFSADNKFLYVPDLGLDEIRIFRVDPAAAKIIPADPPSVQVEPGMGPRHIAFSPDDKFAYVINELKSAVTVFSHDAKTGMLTHLQTISSGKEGIGAAEILVGKRGKFVYSSNRHSGTIAVFSVDHVTGKLTRIQLAETGGTFPRGMELDPPGHYLLAGDQKSDKIAVFSVDARTGQLTLTGQTYQVPSPVSFVFVPVK